MEFNFEKLIGGLISHEDGPLNPIKLVKLLMQSLDQIKINKIDKNVTQIYKNKFIIKNGISI